MSAQKPFGTIVLDAGPLIKNDPTISSLLTQAECLVTSPAVISEIRDAVTRSRVQTLLAPFLTLRSPRLENVKIVTDFSRRTGDLSVLSRTDLQILALAYELECEENGGNWRLRSSPGQTDTNGPRPDTRSCANTSSDPPLREPAAQESGQQIDDSTSAILTNRSEDYTESDVSGIEDKLKAANLSSPPAGECLQTHPTSTDKTQPETSHAHGSQLSGADSSSREETAEESSNGPTAILLADNEDGQTGSDDSDSEGWITPSNIKKHKAKDTAVSQATSFSDPLATRVVAITTDFAMQNVLLQMNLTLLSPSLQRIRHIKTFVLRCHACFNVTKEMGKQFCPRCGQATLRRVACSTGQNGKFRVHLKKNFQWNTRGNRYSVPKPVAGASNPKKVQGGGKGGWGRGLILAEDQKEYTRALEQEKRTKQRDLFDEDYLPAILSGNRARTGGKPKVGAGRNVNSRKR